MRDFIQEINTIMDVIDGTYKQPLPRCKPDIKPDINHVWVWREAYQDGCKDGTCALFANEYYRMTLEDKYKEDL